MSSDRKAFTLIELLVVISIISLLIALLMPALGAARKSAEGERPVHVAPEADRPGHLRLCGRS